MKKYAAVAALGVLALAASASANDPKSYTGQGGAFNDFVDPNPGVTRFEIFVPDSGEIKEMHSVVLNGLTHTWAGDLLITLTHKDTGTTVVLVDRPGVTGGVGFGESQDYNGNYTFADGFAPIPDEFGNAGAALPSGTYGLHTGNALSAFVGEDKFGVWSLVVTDFAGGDTGALGNWVINMSNVPAPGALALLGLAGVAARRRRRSA